MIELGVKNWFLLCTHDRVGLRMHKLLIAEPNNWRGQVVMDILCDGREVSDLLLLALTWVVGGVGESETLPIEKLTLVRMGD